MSTANPTVAKGLLFFGGAIAIGMLLGYMSDVRSDNHKREANRSRFIVDCMVGVDPREERSYFDTLRNCKHGSEAAYPE